MAGENKEEYSRREFLKHNSLAGFGVLMTGSVATVCGSTGERIDGGRGSGEEAIESIGGIGLGQLQKRYRGALFGQFLPHMDSYVVDHDLGGFMTTVDIRTGKQLSTDKRAWYEGRGIWVYSFLYNHFEEDPAYLEIARKSKDFVLQLRPSYDRFWPASFTREGKPLTGPGDIYGNLFIAEGLAEYAKASGEEEYFELAKEIMFDALDRYDQPDYGYPINYGPPEAARIRGPRVLGHWMVFLRLATQILRRDQDPAVRRLADRCVDAVMNSHMNKEYQILNSGLNHDLSLPEDEWAQFSAIGHGIETLWMIMDEAVRRGDTSLFRNSRKAFRRHTRIARDGVYGGHFHTLMNVDQYRWVLDKVLWLQEEVLIGALKVIEHTGDGWARRLFAETEAYIQDTFVRSDFKFWIPSGNRTLADYRSNRAEHYHLPRYLMLNLLALNRIEQRGGRLSGMFAEADDST